MKVVLATPLYPPEIGGPSTYVSNLAPALERAGHQVTVVRYGGFGRLPTGLRHLAYACKLLPQALSADAIVAFDTFSVGLPAAFVSMLVRKPLIIRVGGDFLWENYVNRTEDLVPLPLFYRSREKWRTKEHIVFALTRWTLARSSPVFNSAWLLDIWKNVYGTSVQNARVIENEMHAYQDSEAPKRKNILFYSRQIPLKNAAMFKRAFSKAHDRYAELELDEGIVPHEELMQRMRECYAVAVPSISDVAPNSILDAIRFGKPFILTKYSGYADRFKECGLIVDPLDEADIQRGIEALCDESTHAALVAKIQGFRQTHTYDDIAREFVALLQRHI